MFYNSMYLSQNYFSIKELAVDFISLNIKNVYFLKRLLIKTTMTETWSSAKTRDANLF